MSLLVYSPWVVFRTLAFSSLCCSLPPHFLGPRAQAVIVVAAITVGY